MTTGSSLLTEQEIAINASTDRIFSFISNMENFKLWFPEVLEITSDDELDTATVGKTYLELVNLPPNGKQKLKIEVKQVESPTLYITESEFMPLLPRQIVTLKTVGKRTIVNWKMESRNADKEFINSTLPTFKTVIHERAKMGIKNLKEILEK